MLLIGLSLLLLATAISSSTHKKLAINKVTNESNMVESVHASFSIEKEAAEKIDLTNRNNESLTETQMEEVKFSPHIIIRITFLLLLFSAYLSYNSNYIDNINSGIGVYHGLFQITSLTQSFDFFLYLIAGILLLIFTLNNFTKSVESKDYNHNINSESVTEKLSFFNTGITVEYALIILFNIIGASLLMSSGDLVSMYISIELQSFALYILATLHRDSEKAATSGLKYFLLGGLSSCFILLGAGLLYVSTGLTNLESIFLLFNIEGINKSIEIGLVILLAGFLFKISAAPFHN